MEKSKISIEVLKQRFPDIRDIAPYGFVVVVPGKDFNPDWEFQLEDEGYKVHLMCIVDRKPVTLVSCVKKTVDGREKEVYSPPLAESRSEKDPPNPKQQLTFGNWTPEQDARLIKRMEELEGSLASRSALLSNEFERRSANSLYQHYWKLKRADPKIAEKKKRRSSYKITGKKPQSTDKRATKEQALEASPTAPSEVKRLTEVLDKLVMVVDKLGCQAIMQALEIKELKTQDFKISLGTWTAYANALLEEGKERRDLFRLKVRKLLEATE